MSRKCSQPRRLTARGASMVELALVLPIVLLITFGGIEFARCLRIQQQTISLAREVNNVAFRSCARDANVTSCLATELNGLVQARQAQVDAQPFLVSIYQLDTHGACQLAGEFKSVSDNRVNRRLIDADVDGLCKVQKRLSFVEVYHFYKPLVPAIARMFGLDNEGKFYVVSMF